MISWKTFAVTFLTIESQVDTQTSFPTAPFYEFDKVQFTGTLNESGDRMEVTEAVITNFNEKGELIGGPIKVPSKAHGVRIPLEVLAHPFNVVAAKSVTRRLSVACAAAFLLGGCSAYEGNTPKTAANYREPAAANTDDSLEQMIKDEHQYYQMFSGH